MESQTQDASPNLERQPKKTGLGRKLKFLFAGALIFGAGFALGEGDLALHQQNQTKAPDKLDFSSINQLYDALKINYDGELKQSELLDGLKAGLVKATGDPYTEYFNAKQAKEFNEQLSGSFTGIGAELGSDNDKNITIVSPLSGFPAEKAGLKSKDIIAAINGQSTNGITISEAVRKIRGPAGTKVTLTIIRGSGRPFDIEITRAKITVPSVTSKVEGDIGYLKISQFTTDTPSLARAAAQDFKTKNVKAVVLDLRGDPGGYLDGAVRIASLWLDKGKVVVQQKKGSTVLDQEYATGDNILKGLPTVVLIDGGSASASEIVAGALRDHGAATLVGVKSFGKGSVQKVENLSGGAELKVTIARWYTPNGKNIDKQGIEPDIKVENTEADIAAGKDPQKDKAYETVRQKLR